MVFATPTNKRSTIYLIVNKHDHVKRKINTKHQITELCYIVRSKAYKNRMSTRHEIITRASMTDATTRGKLACSNALYFKLGGSMLPILKKEIT
jgi:hypothetical protein